MKRILLIGAIALACPAFAQTVTLPAVVSQPDGSVVFLKPLVEQLTPIIVTGITGLVAALFAWLKYRADEFLKAKGVRDEQRAALQDALAKAQRYAEREAAALVARSTAGVMSASIDVGHPLVARSANLAFQHVGDAMSMLGLTQDRMAEWIVAEVGKLQAKAPVAALPSPTVNVEKANNVTVEDQTRATGEPVQLPGATLK